jgi:hypothetical protein
MGRRELLLTFLAEPDALMKSCREEPDLLDAVVQLTPDLTTYLFNHCSLYPQWEFKMIHWACKRIVEFGTRVAL